MEEEVSSSVLKSKARRGLEKSLLYHTTHSAGWQGWTAFLESLALQLVGGKFCMV